MEHYQKLLDALSTCIFVLDQDLHIQYLNESAESLIQESANRAAGKLITDLIHIQGDLSDSSFELACKRSLDERIKIGLHDIEVTLPIPRQNRMASIQVSTMELTTGSGFMVELLAQHSEHINYANLNKPHSNQKLIRGLAHEIRNPLGGIRGAAQLLATDLLDHGQRQYTDIIIKEADRLSALIGRMQSSGTPSEQSPLNVHSVLEHVKLLIDAEYEQDVTISVDYDPSLPEIVGDEDQLTQCFLNIVRNAVEAIQSGDQIKQGHILLRTRIDRLTLPNDSSQKQVVRVDVIDNGAGIDPAIREYIFEPMISNKSHGSGLGLSITAEIVSNHGGLIGVKSEPGHTEFNLYLRTIEPVNKS